MISYLSDFANGWTVIDLILIIGFATSTIVLYRKNKQLKIEAMYHNTTNETGQTLIDFEQKTEKQEEKVLSIFNVKKELTASMAWKNLNNTKVPITSIRRAITNLTKSGLLIKTERKDIGLYGSPEHFYKLITA